MAIGTPGGHGIPQTTSQMLLNVLDFGMRCPGGDRGAPHPGLCRNPRGHREPRPGDVRAELEAIGHTLTVLPAFLLGRGRRAGYVPRSGKRRVHRRGRPAPRWVCDGVVGMCHPPHGFPRVAPSSTRSQLTPVSDTGRRRRRRRCKRVAGRRNSHTDTDSSPQQGQKQHNRALQARFDLRVPLPQPQSGAIANFKPRGDY